MERRILFFVFFPPPGDDSHVYAFPCNSRVIIEDIVLGCRAGDAGRTSKGHIIKKMRPFEFMLLLDSGSSVRGF